MSSEKNTTATSTKSEPTMMDIFNIVTATKAEIGVISSRLDKYTDETNEKVQNLQKNVEDVASETAKNSERIEMLEASIEQMKQSQLSNNICISGVPPELLESTNTSEIVAKIANKLGVQITAHQFTSYSVANNKFIIARFFNLKHKQQLQNKVRAKRSLMVEEVFTHTSNSQIYLNDHLTPYMNKLFLMARKAKQDGKLASATSHGGKVRARKSANDAPIIIISESQLQTLIDLDYGNTSNDSIQHVNDSTSESESTSHTQQREPRKQKNKRTPNKSTKTQRSKQHTHKTNKPTNSTADAAPTGRKRKIGTGTGDAHTDPKKLKVKHTENTN